MTPTGSGELQPRRSGELVVRDGTEPRPVRQSQAISVPSLRTAPVTRPRSPLNPATWASTKIRVPAAPCVAARMSESSALAHTRQHPILPFDTPWTSTPRDRSTAATLQADVPATDD